MQLTALQVIRQAALELGLTAPTEVTASTENTGQQMLALLISAGNDLLLAHTWQELNRTYTFSSVIGTAEYDLPTNYAYMIDQTFWNSSDSEEVKGPVSPQTWQRVVAGDLAMPTCEIYRLQQNQVQLLPTPASIANYTYQYITNCWVQDWSTSAYKCTIDNDADVLVLNGNLLVKALKVKMWSAKGLDTTLLLSEFSQLFNMLTGKSKGAQVLSLSPSRSHASNVPETNFG